MLAAAEEQFAAVGYDAARVDDIASSAGVSKSHLYYHFPGKAELFSALIETRTAEMLSEKDEVLAGAFAPAEGVDPLAGAIERAVTLILEPRRAFLRIVLIETLRRPDAMAPVLTAVNSLLDDITDRFAAHGVDLGEDGARLRSTLFHFGVIPALFLVALGGDLTGSHRHAADFATELAAVERAAVQSFRSQS